jgi:hypothetical protein
MKTALRRTAVVGVWLGLVLGGTAFAMAHTPATGSSSAQSAPRVCFPAARWDADDAERPCVRVVRLYEDGSLVVRVSDADGTVRYTAGVGALDR